jgi:outer membrane lipoprotein carrier protein
MPTRVFVRRLLVCVALVVLGLSVGLAGDALAARVPDPMDVSLTGEKRLAALIERMKIEQSKMKTMQAQFVQKRESDLLLEAEESSGAFYFEAPDRVRWEYAAPEPISVLIDGKEMTTWYQDLNRADKLKIGRYSTQVFKYMGASGNVETLVDYFRVTAKFPEKAGEPYRLRLHPRYDRIKDKLKSMTLWIDGKHFIPTRVTYVTTAGDTTEYEFRDLRINQALPGDPFDLKMPTNVQVRELDLGQDAER